MLLSAVIFEGFDFLMLANFTKINTTKFLGIYLLKLMPVELNLNSFTKINET